LSKKYREPFGLDYAHSMDEEHAAVQKMIRDERWQS
jgi:hypothetical protein